MSYSGGWHLTADLDLILSVPTEWGGNNLSTALF